MTLIHLLWWKVFRFLSCLLVKLRNGKAGGASGILPEMVKVAVCGISLLDVVGKVVARVLQVRLQKLAEEELPESQCGFRRGEVVQIGFLLSVSWWRSHWCIGQQESSPGVEGLWGP